MTMPKNLVLEFTDEADYQLVVNLLQRLNVKYQENIPEAKQDVNPPRGVKLGSLAGKGFDIPDDFNEPLDDLKH